MLISAAELIRLSLHVLAATIWVGGQFTLAGLVPTLRQGAPGVIAPVARRFAQLAWPAYGILVVTGLWNIAATNPAHQSAAWRAVLMVKVVVVLVSGVSMFAHQRSKTTAGLAIWGALGSLSAVAALVLGVALAG